MLPTAKAVGALLLQAARAAASAITTDKSPFDTKPKRSIS